MAKAVDAITKVIDVITKALDTAAIFCGQNRSGFGSDHSGFYDQL